MRGLFITFEGGEGSGKTTQIKSLSDWVADQVPDVSLCLTREPGGTEEAESIRALLLNGAASKWQPATEAMMMSASRHEHVVHIIQPALERGDIVICDRFTDSTHVYQGYVGGVDQALLDGLDQLSCQGLAPDLTLLLDMDSNAGLARTIQRGSAESRFEAKGAAFHQQVRQGF
ncbi:MAG: dTMP kinase, partial [Candidatus Puniceispirillaceae bacterium]